jgi:hypothetical protein
MSPRIRGDGAPPISARAIAIMRGTPGCKARRVVRIG